jgi:hypothetical protein
MRRLAARTAQGLLALILAVGSMLSATLPAAHTSVFENSKRWPLSPQGYALIPVCIVAGSSAKQLPIGVIEGQAEYLNPTLDTVIGHVRSALSESWEKYGGVGFTGWGSCQDLTEQARAESVGLYIHPDAASQAFIGTDSKGKTSVAEPGVQFKPWAKGSFASSLAYTMYFSSIAMPASSSMRSTSLAISWGSTTNGRTRAHRPVVLPTPAKR